MRLRCSTIIALACAMLLGAGSIGHAQTVTVGKALTPDGLTTFNTIRDAMLSFTDDVTSGPNALDPAPNVIRIVDFGPYDEVLPGVFDETAPGGGAVALIRLNASDPTLTIEGPSTKSLVLAQQVYSRSSIAARGNCKLVLRNLIVAPSATSTPERHLIQPVDSGAQITIEDCVLTALPAEATSYTAVADLPAGILDGSRAHEADYVRPTADSGSYGHVVNINSNSSCTLKNTVITQAVRQSAESFALLVRLGGTLQLLEGTQLINNGAGIRVRDGSRLDIRGTAANRVLIGQNNWHGPGWINLEALAQAEITECNFLGRPQSLDADSDPQNCLYVGAAASLTVRECIFAGGFTGSGGSNAIYLVTLPAALVLDDLSILQHRYGIVHGAAMNYTLTDSIIAETFFAFTNGPADVTVQNCALPTEGPNANQNLAQDTTLNLLATTQADPLFASIVPGEAGFALVTNGSYATARSDGGPLDGGGAFLAPPNSVGGHWLLLD